MKKYLSYSFIAAIAATMMLTTACSGSDALAEEQAPYVPEPVNFSIGLSDAGITRAQASGTTTSLVNSVESKFSNGDYVAVYTTDADGKNYTKAYTTGAWDGTSNNAPLTQAESGATGQFYWKSTSDKKVYEAYSFGTSTAIAASQSDVLKFDFSTDADTPEPFTVTTDQTEATGFKDFLYNFGTVTYSTEGKQIQLNHQLARIDVRVITDKHYTTINGESGNLVYDKSLTIGKDTEAGGISIAGTFAKPTNFSTYTAQNADDLTHGSTWTAADYGKWTAVAGDGNANIKAITPRVITAEAAGTGDYAGKYETKYSAVVIPQTIASGKTMFTLVYDGATYVYSPASAITILPGKRHQYLIVVTPQGLKVTTVAIKDWDDVDEAEAPVVLQGS